jgi:hypothetical protein
VDQIKVYSRLQRAVYLAIVDEAHQHGLKAVGHIPISVSLEEAMEAGQDSAEHLVGFGSAIGRLAGQPEAGELATFEESESGWPALPRLDKTQLAELLRAVRHSGIVHCPTLVVMQGMARLSNAKAKDDPLLDYVPSELRGFWQSETYAHVAEGAARALPHMQALVGELHQAGAPLLCGTDLANPHVIAGHSLHEEMALWQDAGVPPADILRSATILPARFFGRGERLGAVGEGKAASLVLVRGSPLADIRNARNIEGVFLRGRYFDRAELDGLLAEVKESVAASRPTRETIELSLPGEVVKRGRYKATFEQWDAGIEDFVITRNKDGYHLMAHNQPQGGPQAPFVLTMHVGPDFSFRSADWRGADWLRGRLKRSTVSRESNSRRRHAKRES